MLDIENQLRLYGDDLAAKLGPDALFVPPLSGSLADSARGPATGIVPDSDPDELTVEATGPLSVDVPTGRDERQGRGHGRALLVAAALFVIAAIGLRTVLKEDSSTVITDVPSITTSVPDSLDLDESKELLEPTELAPRGWVMAYQAFSEVSDEAANEVSSEVTVWAFGDSSGTQGLDTDDGLPFILVTQPVDGESPLSEAVVETQRNRSSLWWTDGPVQLGLEGFDQTEAQMRQAAEALSLVNGQWLMPGRELITTGSPMREAYRNRTVEFSRVDRGSDDLGETGDYIPGSVDQTAAPLTEADLFLYLFDLSDLGSLERVEIDGLTGYLLDTGVSAYALLYRQGQFLQWRIEGTGDDLRLFLEELEPVPVAEWDRMAVAAEEAFAALDERSQTSDGAIALATLTSLPRFGLGDDWTLATAYDESLWSESDRLALERAKGGDASWGRTVERRWVQTFSRTGHEGPLGEIGVVMSSVSGEPLFLGDVTGCESHHEPFIIFGYVGCAWTDDTQPQAATFDWTVLVAENGSTSIRIVSDRLDETELRAFAQSLSLRSDGGLDGVDSEGSDFEAGIDRTSAELDTSQSQQTWSTSWVDGEHAVRLQVVAETNEKWEESFVPLGGTEWNLISENPQVFRTQTGLTWHDDHLQITAMIWGFTFEENTRSRVVEDMAPVLAAYRSLTSLTEAEWVALTAPVLARVEDVIPLWDGHFRDYQRDFWDALREAGYQGDLPELD